MSQTTEEHTLIDLDIIDDYLYLQETQSWFLDHTPDKTFYLPANIQHQHHINFYYGETLPLDIEYDSIEVKNCDSCSTLNLSKELLVCGSCLSKFCTCCQDSQGKWIHNPLMCPRCQTSSYLPHTLHFACCTECEDLLKVMYV